MGTFVMLEGALMATGMPLNASLTIYLGNMV